MALNVPGLSTTQINRLEGVVFGAVAGLVTTVVSTVYQAVIYPALTSGTPDFANVNWQYAIMGGLVVGLPICGARIMDGFEKVLQGTVDNTIPPNVLIAGTSRDDTTTRIETIQASVPLPLGSGYQPVGANTGPQGVPPHVGSSISIPQPPNLTTPPPPVPLDQQQPSTNPVPPTP